MHRCADELDKSLLPFASLGNVAIVGGVLCCLGLKVIGGVAPFGVLAAMFGVSTDATTFIVGAVGGLLLAVLVVGYRQSDVAIRSG